MFDEPCSIVIPVGPRPGHRAYLKEAIASAVAAKPDRVILVADGVMVNASEAAADSRWVGGPDRWYLRSTIGNEDPAAPRVEQFVLPWRVGVPGAFNTGVALSGGFALMLGADDTVEPDVLTRWRAEAAKHPTDPYLTYWALPLRYMDTGEEQSLPCNAAIVHVRLWRLTGGFAPETASGACDAALLSTMLGNYPRAGIIREVGGPPLYHYRRHAGTDTAGRQPWQGVILATRDILTKTWEPQ